LKVVFFGTPEFAVPALDALIASGYDVLSVVTQPDRPSGRGRRVVLSPVKIRARRDGIRVLQPTSIQESGFISDLRSMCPSVIVVIAYGQLLRQEILGLPRHGCINVHASLLPLYRGAAPINWAVIRGDKLTGVTTILMDEGMDTGPILLQDKVEIRSDDTAGSLSEELSRAGAAILIRTLDMLGRGDIVPRPQSGEATNAPPLKKRDGLIVWSRPADELYNLIRGVYPWPGAYTFLKGERIRILKASVVDGRGESGVVQNVSKSELLVGTGDGLLSIRELQVSGRAAAGIKAFLQGRRISRGMKFHEERMD
jgi:methionyl-tRNA formyltransferase